MSGFNLFLFDYRLKPISVQFLKKGHFKKNKVLFLTIAGQLGIYNSAVS